MDIADDMAWKISSGIDFGSLWVPSPEGEFPECQGALLKASMNNDHDENDNS